MTFAEALGQALLVTLAGTGLLVLALCLYLGARELVRRVKGQRTTPREESVCRDQ